MGFDSGKRRILCLLPGSMLLYIDADCYVILSTSCAGIDYDAKAVGWKDAANAQSAERKFSGASRANIDDNHGAKEPTRSSSASLPRRPVISRGDGKQRSRYLSRHEIE